MPDHCFDRNPRNLGMTCGLPAGHADDHRFSGDPSAATWPRMTEAELERHFNGAGGGLRD